MKSVSSSGKSGVVIKGIPKEENSNVIGKGPQQTKVTPNQDNANDIHTNWLHDAILYRVVLHGGGPHLQVETRRRI